MCLDNGRGDRMEIDTWQGKERFPRLGLLPGCEYVSMYITQQVHLLLSSVQGIYQEVLTRVVDERQIGAQLAAISWPCRTEVLMFSPSFHISQDS